MNTEQINQEWEKLATNLRVEKALIDALDVLSGIRTVVFKGALLTRMLYGDLRKRASADNDLWIPGDHIEEALCRLEVAGYLPCPGIDSRAAIKRVGQIALWKDGDVSQVSLDLHAEPFSSRYFEVNEATLLSHLVSTEIHGRAVETFDPPLALLHMVAHWVQHHFEERMLSDIKVGWNKVTPSCDSAMLLELAEKTCTAEALELALALAHPGLPPPLPLRRARVKIVHTVIASSSQELPSIVRKFLTLVLVAPQKLPLGISSAIFLEKDDLEHRYGKGKRGILLLRHLWRSLSH